MTDNIIVEEKKELTQEEKDILVQEALEEMTQVYSEGFKEMGQGMLQGFDENIDDFEVTKQAVEAGDAQTLYKQLIGQYEKTVAHIKDAATKEYTEINTKIEANEVLTEHEADRISKAIVILNGITELETNEMVLKFLVENDENERVKKDLKNHFFTRRAEEDFVHKMRTVKIKAANVKGNYDLIMAVKNTEFRNKLMYYYATFLNSFKNNSTTIDALRYFVVFQMGMFRISIQTGYTFEAMEIVYATLANKELPSYMTAKADTVEA